MNSLFLGFQDLLFCVSLVDSTPEAWKENNKPEEGRPLWMNSWKILSEKRRVSCLADAANQTSINVSAWGSGKARSLFSLNVLVCYAWKQGGKIYRNSSRRGSTCLRWSPCDSNPSLYTRISSKNTSTNLLRSGLNTMFIKLLNVAGAYTNSRIQSHGTKLCSASQSNRI